MKPEAELRTATWFCVPTMHRFSRIGFLFEYSLLVLTVPVWLVCKYIWNGDVAIALACGYYLVASVVYKVIAHTIPERAAMKYLEDDRSATNWPVILEYKCRSFPFTTWSDLGAMVIEGDHIAFSSGATSFLIGAQDIASVKVYADLFIDVVFSNRKLHRLRVNPIVRAGIIDESEDRKEFVQRLVELANSGHSTEEPRTLPPARSPRVRSIVRQ